MRECNACVSVFSTSTRHFKYLAVSYGDKAEKWALVSNTQQIILQKMYWLFTKSKYYFCRQEEIFSKSSFISDNFLTSFFCKRDFNEIFINLMTRYSMVCNVALPISDTCTLVRVYFGTMSKSMWKETPNCLVLQIAQK